jgi:hypothetical protein
MNHSSMENDLEGLESTRNYCMEEYRSLTKKEKDAFNIQFNKYIANMAS